MVYGPVFAPISLARKFAQIPRSGSQVYGFAAGLYPTDAPTLPEPDPPG